MWFGPRLGLYTVQPSSVGCITFYVFLKIKINMSDVIFDILAQNHSTGIIWGVSTRISEVDGCVQQRLYGQIFYNLTVKTFNGR